MATGVKLRGIVSVTMVGAVAVGGVDDSDVNLTLATVDATDHDSGGWGVKMTTFNDISGTLKGYYLDGDTNQQTLMAAIIAATLVTIKLRPNGTGTGKTEWSGPAYLAGFKWTSPTKGVQTFEVPWVGAGAWATTTVQT